jgi:hypothetical protein
MFAEGTEFDAGRIRDILRKLRDVKTYLHTLFPTLLIAVPVSLSSPSTPTSRPSGSRPKEMIEIGKAGDWADDLLRTRVQMLSQLRFADYHVDHLLLFSADFLLFIHTVKKPASAVVRIC